MIPRKLSSDSIHRHRMSTCSSPDSSRDSPPAPEPTTAPLHGRGGATSSPIVRIHAESTGGKRPLVELSDSEDNDVDLSPPKRVDTGSAKGSAPRKPIPIKKAASTKQPKTKDPRKTKATTPATKPDKTPRKTTKKVDHNTDEFKKLCLWIIENDPEIAVGMMRKGINAHDSAIKTVLEDSETSFMELFERYDPEAGVTSLKEYIDDNHFTNYNDWANFTHTTFCEMEDMSHHMKCFRDTTDLLHAAMAFLTKTRDALFQNM